MTTPTPTSDNKNKNTNTNCWKKNLRLMGVLLFLWFFFSLGCGVLWVDTLNQFNLPGTGFKLGFWFAQQGSILAFVLIVLLYAILMNRMDRSPDTCK
jgi:putative solute:sodium symporter small subunit